MDGVNDFESSITSMSDMWAMDKSFFKELPELSVISRPDAKLTDEANRATLESLEVLKRIEMNTEYLKNIVVKVKTAKGSTAAVYKKAHFPLYVSDQSYKDFKITIPKSDLKIKKTIDLRNASIQTDGKYGYTYYSY